MEFVYWVEPIGDCSEGCDNSIGVRHVKVMINVGCAALRENCWSMVQTHQIDVGSRLLEVGTGLGW